MSTASDAAELADRIAAAIRGQEVLFPNFGPWAEAYLKATVDQALTHGMKPFPPMPPEPSNQQLVREITYTAQDAAIRRLWQQHRIVYDVDATLWNELGDTDADTVIPAGLFSRLPHPDPFIAIPHPLVIPVDATQQMRVVGFFIVGRADHQAARSDWVGITQVSTHAPNTNGKLGILIAAFVETLDGKQVWLDRGDPDMIFNRMTLEADDHADVTVGALIAGVLRRFDAYSGANSMRQIPTLITACTSALIYVCSTNAELRPLPAPAARRKAKSRGAAKPAKVIQVGHQIGAKLRAYRRSEAEAVARYTTGKKRPHIRRAHFHLYWTGPGRTEPQMKWLSPIPINASDTPAEKTTVVGIERTP